MSNLIENIAPELMTKWREWGLKVGLCCDPVDRRAAKVFGEKLMVWLGRKTGPVSVQGSPLTAWLAVCAISDGKWDGGGDRQFGIDNVPKGLPELVWPYLDGAFWANYAAWVGCLEEAGVTGLPKDLDIMREALNYGPIWPLEQHVVISDRPEKIAMKDGRLHCEDGPAVRYRDGFSVWALNGVRLPIEVVTTPGEAMDAGFLRRYLCDANVNAEVRREVVRKVGVSLVIERLGGKVIDRSEDGVYELILLDIGDDRPRPYLKMRNPSIGIYHVEGVDPECKTVQEALNFRNGLTEDMIDDENGAEWIQQGDVLLFPAGAKKVKRQPKKLT